MFSAVDLCDVELGLPVREQLAYQSYRVPLLSVSNRSRTFRTESRYIGDFLLIHYRVREYQQRVHSDTFARTNDDTRYRYYS